MVYNLKTGVNNLEITCISVGYPIIKKVRGLGSLRGWWVPLTGLTPLYFRTCLKKDPEFPTTYLMVVFLCVQ